MEDAGWRGKIGWIQPPGGALDPFEFLQLAPPGFRIIPTMTNAPGLAGTVSSDMYYAIIDQVQQVSHILKEAGADIIAQSGSPMTFLQGLVGARAMHSRIEDAVGIPFVMMGLAMLKAANEFGFERAAVAAAGYPDEWRDAFKRFIEEGGVSVLGIENWVQQGIFRTQEEASRALQPLHSKVTLGMTYKGAVTIARKCRDADCLFILGGAMVALPIIEALEEDLGIPVITAASATFWEIFKRLGTGAPVHGYGAILESLGT